MSEKSFKKKISVLGLGQMGRKLAQLCIQNGHPVTVWNRTPGKVHGLNPDHEAATAAEAIGEAEIVIICVYDNAAVNEILAAVKDKSILRGKTFINFTTGGPEEVENLESQLEKSGAAYLNGAIQVAPEQMAMPDTTILMAGDRQAFESCKEVLDNFGGNIKYLGEKASASPAMDLATLSWVYASFFGLLYGVALCRSAGISLEEYSKVISEISPSFLEFYKHEIKMVAQENFEITQSPMSISVIASQRITEAVAAVGLDPVFTDVIAAMLRSAKENGLENQEAAALIKLIEKTVTKSNHVTMA